MAENRFADITWEERWNNPEAPSAYVSDEGAGWLFTVSSLGVLRVMKKDVPAVVQSLLSYCDALEGFCNDG